MGTYLRRKLSTCVLKINIFNMWMRYGVTNKKYIFVFDSDILEDVSFDMPNTI